MFLHTICCLIHLTLVLPLASNLTGKYTSTGINLFTPRTALGESALNIPPVIVQAPIAITYLGSGICSYRRTKTGAYFIVIVPAVIINAHLEESLGVDELAQVVQMSSGYFSRLFKQSTGLAPHQYLIQCRVNRAKYLLSKGNAITDVAYKVGFANQAHLNYHFKRLLGVTPRAVLQK